MDIVIHSFKDGLHITIFVFAMMLLVDYINVLTRGKINQVIKGKGFRQYFTTSFLGATPGCLGVFMNVSFYAHGLVSFGAIAGGMIAGCGDEAFVMLSMFPQQAVLIFMILFILGICFGWLVDKAAPLLKIKPSGEECLLASIHLREEECRLLNLNEIINHLKAPSLTRFLLLALLGISIYAVLAGIIGHEEGGWIKATLFAVLLITMVVVVTVPEHYLEEHIWKHIAKKHLWSIFLWSFGCLLLVNVFLTCWNLEEFIHAHLVWVLLIAALVGIVPESGPHLIFVVMFAKGLIPFSVLLTSCIVQDGHGMLPLLSYSIKDALLIKAFNLLIGLGVGLILYSLGW